MSDTFDFDWQATDNTILRGKAWIPSGGAKYVVCLIHGFGEHIGRYAHVAEFFNRAGIGLLGFDQRGHGLSGGEKGHTPSYAQLMSDIGQFIALVSEKLPSSKLILYGHSMGGNLVLNFALTQNMSKIHKLVSTSPLLRVVNQPPAIKLFLGKMMDKVYPAYTEQADLDVNQLSTDLIVGQAYKADTLVHGTISARLFSCVMSAGEWAILNIKELTTPTLLMHGLEDKITCSKATQELGGKADKNLLTQRYWEGMRHEMHNEKAKEEYLTFILQWIMLV